MGLDIYFFQRTKAIKTVAQFRKVNFLVEWVHSHVADVENCQDIVIDREKVEVLYQDLCSLNKTNADEIMPTFGLSEYDERYWSNVGETKEVCEDILANFDFENYHLVFHAWW